MRVCKIFLIKGRDFFGFIGWSLLIWDWVWIGELIIGFLFLIILKLIFIVGSGVKIFENKIILLGLKVLKGCRDIFIVRFVFLECLWNEGYFFCKFW